MLRACGRASGRASGRVSERASEIPNMQRQLYELTNTKETFRSNLVCQCESCIQ